MILRVNCYLRHPWRYLRSDEPSAPLIYLMKEAKRCQSTRGSCRRKPAPRRRCLVALTVTSETPSLGSPSEASVGVAGCWYLKFIWGIGFKNLLVKRGIYFCVRTKFRLRPPSANNPPSARRGFLEGSKVKGKIKWTTLNELMSESAATRTDLRQSDDMFTR